MLAAPCVWIRTKIGIFHPPLFDAAFWIEMLRNDRWTLLPSLHRTPDKLQGKYPSETLKKGRAKRLVTSQMLRADGVERHPAWWEGAQICYETEKGGGIAFNWQKQMSASSSRRTRFPPFPFEAIKFSASLSPSRRPVIFECVLRRVSFAHDIKHRPVPRLGLRTNSSLWIMQSVEGWGDTYMRVRQRLRLCSTIISRGERREAIDCMDRTRALGASDCLSRPNKL